MQKGWCVRSVYQVLRL